jgi:hypothetical protein
MGGNRYKPLRHDVQPPIHQGMAVNGSISHENPDLAVVCLTRGAGIWERCANKTTSAGFMDYQGKVIVLRRKSEPARLN